MTKFKSNAIDSGVGLRQEEVAGWLRKRGFKGEYLLVSTKKEVRDQRSEIRGGRLIVDLYTPLMLEKKVSFRWWNPLDWRIRQVMRNNIKSYLLAGDHFLVANRRQREYWIETAGSLGVKLGRNDISVLPTGASRLQVAGCRLQVARRNVVLWFGGIYPWMDPWPLVEALGRLAPKFPDWKLRILGGWQPGTGYKGIYRRLREFSERVIPQNQLEFIPWQREKDLGKYFKDVAFAVHLAKQTPEDYYAHRVRLLTLTNAGIPVLTSGKDVISDLIVAYGAGKRVVNETREIADAVSELLKSPKTVRSLSQKAGETEQLFIRQETDI